MSNEANSNNGSGGESVIVDVGRSRSICGYCKSGRLTSISHGMNFFFNTFSFPAFFLSFSEFDRFYHLTKNSDI